MADTDYSYLALRMMLYGSTKNFSTQMDAYIYGSCSNNYPYINSLETNFEDIPRPVLNEILYVSNYIEFCCFFFNEILYFMVLLRFFNVFCSFSFTLLSLPYC